MASRPAPNRQFAERFVTPLIGDVLFSERWHGLARNIPAYGTAHPNTARWPNHKLVYVRERDEADTSETYEFFYAAARANQDSYNYNFTKADIGGQRFDAVVRTYVTLRSAFTPETPAMGATMPNVPSGLFTGSYVLARKEQRRIGDAVLDSLFVAEEHTYVKRCNIRDIGVDSLNGRTLTSTETLYYATEVVTGSTTASQLFADSNNAYWGLQTNGTQRSGRQLSCEWYQIEESQVVGGTFTDGVVTVDSYTTNDRYFWPPVLDTLDFLDWQRNDGGTDIYPAIRFHPEGYNGPCRNTITRTWSKTPFTIPVVELMQPTRIYYASPFFTLNIPESLHPQVVAVCDIGTSDPVYALNTGSARYFAATNFTTWPATIVAYDDQEPFRGGYLRTRRVIDRPPIPANVNWLTGTPI